MAVSAEQVELLRAVLKGDMDRYQQLSDRLDSNLGGSGYPALVGAAFFTAAERRFDPATTTTADLIEFVGDVRTRSEGAAEHLDPNVAEKMLRALVKDDDEGATEFDSKAILHTQLVLLGALVADARLDDDQLDALLTTARRTADKWLE